MHHRTGLSYAPFVTVAEVFRSIVERAASTVMHRARPTRDEADQEACTWIARLHADDASPEDLAQFEAWRRADPRNDAAYESASATWNYLASLKDRDERQA